jgi:hypothetical protein
MKLCIMNSSAACGPEKNCGGCASPKALLVDDVQIESTGSSPSCCFFNIFRYNQLDHDQLEKTKKLAQFWLRPLEATAEGREIDLKL